MAQKAAELCTQRWKMSRKTCHNEQVIYTHVMRSFTGVQCAFTRFLAMYTMPRSVFHIIDASELCVQH